MHNETYHEYRQLKEHGWDVSTDNRIRFNSGSETVRHAVSKMLAGFALQQAGYRVDSEVTHTGRGEIDVLGYGHEDRITLAVECETSPTDEIIEDKVNRYVRNTPIDDIAVINVTELPENTMDAYVEVTEVLGLDGD